eukprot:TRINITY_DN9677_c0_g3_i1.p1 TRINITY_DN9677_c0_g3~~TRINITY_DN9677_c0_g3_i1.p1  ORF type:complete len:400 (+),score=32.22 TRINITY_DN9677_c0_g3_i1:151-1350(+)
MSFASSGDVVQRTTTQRSSPTRAAFRRRSSAGQIVSALGMLPDRAPSRERLGVGYGSRLELEQAQLQSDEGQHERPKFVLGSVHARLDYAEHNARRRATSMLCLGSTFGFFGFSFSAVLGMQYTYARTGHKLNFLGEHFPSGEDFWPGSVSEMVHDPSTPTGEIWKCFVLIGALSIWLSWYPWELRNVYTGGSVRWFFCIPFLHLRTFMPPIGMMLVAFVPLPQSSNFGETFASAIHYAGASTALGGYGVFEFYTLVFAEYVHMEPKERILRSILCATCLMGLFGFLVAGFLPKTSLCCGDEWRVPTAEDVALAKANGYPGLAMNAQIAKDTDKALLYNTASGIVLALKYVAYWSEVTAGLSMLFSMFTIWYFAPERLVEMGNEIPWPDKDEESDDSPS